MRSFLKSALVAALVLCCSSAYAGQIWTDFNGDGLPDPVAPFPVPANTNVTVGVWFDSQTFTWTNYLAFVEWTPGVTFQGATYVITGGSNFPLDTFSNPNAVGFGGFGFNRSGVSQVGNMTVRIPLAGCVSPIIDVYNPFGTFSSLGAGAAYFLFTTNPGSCFGEPPPQTGACCFPDFSCQILSGSQCAAAGGSYQGDNSDCSACPPPPPTGACCFPDFTCQILTATACAQAGGAYAGDGTDCSICPPPPATGACCFPDFTCQILTAAACAQAGGAYAGDNTPCSVCPPPPVFGACCFADFTCQILTAAQCAAAGGSYAGDNTDCSACPPPPATGACCFQQDCVITTQAACVANGGTYQGDNTTCAPINPCINAVESTSWGEIKGLYR